MRYVFLFLLCISSLFAATCPPCTCVESSSSEMQSKYLETQLSFLDGYIKPDIQLSIDKAKLALENIKTSYNNIAKTEEITLHIIKEEAEMVNLLEKLIKQKQLDLQSKLIEIKAKVENNQVVLTSTK